MTSLITENIPQLIGVVALIFSVISFQINNRSRLLIVQATSNLFWCTHFFLIGAFTGSAMNLLAIGRNYSFVKYKEKFPGIWLPSLVIFVFTVASVLTWQGLISLLPLFGMVTGTIAFWQTKPRVIRQMALLAPPAWFTYNLLSHSYPGMIVETLVFCSICIAIIRYDILGQPEKVTAK